MTQNAWSQSRTAQIPTLQVKKIHYMRQPPLTQTYEWYTCVKSYKKWREATKTKLVTIMSSSSRCSLSRFREGRATNNVQTIAA